MACYKNLYDLQTLFENMAHNAIYQILTGYRYNVHNIKTFLGDFGTKHIFVPFNYQNDIYMQP